jgi:hypothetical protein
MYTLKKVIGNFKIVLKFQFIEWFHPYPIKENNFIECHGFFYAFYCRTTVLESQNSVT